MISTKEAAALKGVSHKTMMAWIDNGRALGLAAGRRPFCMPIWQFEPVMWKILPRLCSALGTIEGWALLAFLETPIGALHGDTPRAGIEQGKPDRVLQLALMVD